MCNSTVDYDRYPIAELRLPSSRPLSKPSSLLIESDPVPLDLLLRFDRLLAVREPLVVLEPWLRRLLRLLLRRCSAARSRYSSLCFPSSNRKPASSCGPY